jgi:hypothetical protein
MPAWCGGENFDLFYLKQFNNDHVLIIIIIIIIKAAVVWDVTPCGVVDLDKCVEAMATGSSDVDISTMSHPRIGDR